MVWGSAFHAHTYHSRVCLAKAGTQVRGEAQAQTKAKADTQAEVRAHALHAAARRAVGAGEDGSQNAVVHQTSHSGAEAIAAKVRRTASILVGQGMTASATVLEEVH